MKKTMVLVGDCWHPGESIEPLVRELFPATEDCVFTEDPGEFYRDEYGVLVSFKDPVEDNRVPTPTWCDERWTEELFRRIEGGMGYLAVHAGVADMPDTHRIARELHRAVFLMHPEPCRVTVVPEGEHPILEGVETFELPEPDEHYHMRMLPGPELPVLARTVSVHGSQPALWAHTYGRGRVCVFTPGHTTPILTCPGYVRLMRNMLAWCGREQA